MESVTVDGARKEKRRQDRSNGGGEWRGVTSIRGCWMKQESLKLHCSKSKNLGLRQSVLGPDRKFLILDRNGPKNEIGEFRGLRTGPKQIGPGSVLFGPVGLRSGPIHDRILHTPSLLAYGR